MSPSQYDIYDMVLHFRQSEGARPWVVVENPAPSFRDPSQVVVTAMPISTKFDLRNDATDFTIWEEHPDFEETGLDCTCYVAGRYPTSVPTEAFDRADWRGRLTGELLEEFRAWLGL